MQNHMEDRNGKREEYICESRRSRGKGLIIFLIIAIVFMAGVFLSIGTSSRDSREDRPEVPDSPYVAMLSVDGVIQSENTTYLGRYEGYQHEWTLDRIDDLILDENNCGIMLRINTPGGGVYESDELYLKLMEYKEETNRPVVAYMQSEAASGGYYISMAADKVYANRNCWTGSIGVTIGTLYDITGLLEKYGIKTTTIDSGTNKSMGSMTEELTEEQQAILQGLVNEAYEQFVSIVAEGRGMDVSEVKPLADGRIYSAKQAKQLGLIDEIMTEEEAKSEMCRAFYLPDAEFIPIDYVDESGLLDRLLSATEGLKTLTGSGSENELKDVIALTQNEPGHLLRYQCEVVGK